MIDRGRTTLRKATAPHLAAVVPMPVVDEEMNAAFLKMIAEAFCAGVSKARVRKDITRLQEQFQTPRLFVRDCNDLITLYRGEALERTPLGHALEAEQ